MNKSILSILAKSNIFQYKMPLKSRTKIIATIGPSTWDEGILTSIIENGVDIARINASFADHEELDRVSKQIRNISPRVAIMLDTMGHKIRVEGITEDIKIKEGSTIKIIPHTSHKHMKGYISITYPDLYKYISKGNIILIDDGNIKLEVEDINGKEISTKVIVGTVIKPKKTVNIPHVHLDFPTLSDKDIKDIQFAVDHHFDLVSASFIRNKDDVMQVQKILSGSEIKIVAKIEDSEGIKNFDEILEEVDAIMIARGDMGVELPLEQVPIIQKALIKKCREKGKPVIVATQMLESMRESITPTRAEVSDCANAVLDLTDCVMLSAETSTGKFPVEAVTMMSKIINETEKITKPEIVETNSQAQKETDAVCRYIAKMSEDIKLSGVIVLSQTGKTIASISRHRISIPIYAVTNNPLLFRQMNLFYGVEAIYQMDFALHRDDIVNQAVTTVYSKGNLDLNDKVAIISGSSIYNKKVNSILEIVNVKDAIG